MNTSTARSIQFMDLKQQYLSIRSEVLQAVDHVFSETAFSGGKFVESFESEFAKYCGTNYALGVSNGTDALHLGLRALGIGPGDEVIVPANTFVATAWAVSYVGATPVFVDCDSDTWNISIQSLKKAINGKTRAVMGVHLYGLPFDVDGVKELLKDYPNVLLIEDCAQAHGATINGIKVGGFGRFAGFSFYPGKNLGAFGEAGGITTNDTSLYKKIQSLRNHGSVKRYYHDELGFNHRMDGIQGAILSIKLKHLDLWTKKRQELADIYRSELKNLVQMQKVPEALSHVYHLFVIQVSDRQKFIDYLNSESIYPGQHYPVPCHLQKAYSHLEYSQGMLPNAEQLANQCVSLPLYPELEWADQERVIKSIKLFFGVK